MVLTTRDKCNEESSSNQTSTAIIIMKTILRYPTYEILPFYNLSVDVCG